MSGRGGVLGSCIHESRLQALENRGGLQSKLEDEGDALDGYGRG